MDISEKKTRAREWMQACKPFCKPNVFAAVYQLTTTIGAYITTATLAVVGAQYHYGAAVPFVLLLGALIVRLFIFQHDCGHGSYLPSRRWNDIVGHLLSLFTLVPYSVWRFEHNLHHAGSGNLDKRGIGDIDVLTDREFLGNAWYQRLWYHIFRNIFFLMFIGGPFYFLVLNRVPWGRGMPIHEAWRNILTLNLAVVLILGLVSVVAGIALTLSVFLGAAYVGSAIGVWLFYVQHQFEDVQWYRNDEWDFAAAAIYGSSYYELHPVLAWFTGNIGIHHIHHLSVRIPNYNLRACLEALPELKSVNRLTFSESVKCAFLKLWYERKRRLGPFP